MIAKRILRKAASSNFGRLGQYILDTSISDAVAVTARTAEYVLDLKGDGARVGAVRFSNCEADTPQNAVKEIIATQGLNVRAKGDRTYHLVVSFAPGEYPSEAQLADIETTLCQDIGLGTHQRLSAVHTDTDHLHIHIAINKVHPTTYRLIEPFYDQYRLMAACEALERKHGLQRTSHGAVVSKERRGRSDAAETEAADQFRDRARALFKAGLESRLNAVTDWPSLQDAFADHGLVLRRRGAGLVIADVNGSVSVKASDIDRGLTFSALTARFGAFGPSQAEGRAADLNHAGEDEALATIKASYKKRSEAIRLSRTLTAVGKRAAYRDLNRLRQTAYDRWKTEHDRKCKPAKTDGKLEQRPVRTCHETDQPAPGDPQLQAQSALQSYVSARNSLRDKISDLAYHRLWMLKDGGAGLYRGRRKLADGSWALLLLKGETMLVKALSDAEAETAKAWPLNKPLTIDAGGRIVTRAPRRR